MTASKQGLRTTPSRIAPKPRRARGGRSRAALEDECARLRELCGELRENADLATRTHRELLSVVSHDLRNPLSVVLVSSRLLLKTLPPELAARKQIEAIGRAADEINLMVQDLVDAASMQAGRFSVGQEPNHVAPLVDKALEALQPIASSKPLILSKDVAEDLPPVLCDPERIIQVFTNLIGNAVRFTPKGGSIAVRAERMGSEACFAVSDTGPGIPTEDRTLVFVRREGERRHISQGTGLAVFVARGIVEAHGGRMWIESQVGQGSTFYFTLSVAESPASSRSPRRSEPTRRLEA